MIIFNSYEYILFLFTVVVLYWFLPRIYQNLLLLGASYFFYATWDWRYLSIIIFLTLCNYYLGKKICSASSEKAKWGYAAAGIITDIAILGFFKYVNFFLESLDSFLSLFGLSVFTLHLDIILPLGISFYTFQKVAYLYDLYKGRTEPADSLLTFALFSCFFPQLVAGPIERPSHLLPQIQKERIWSKNDLLEGIDQIIWGLVKKIVVADNVASYVNMIFALKEPSTLLILVATFGFGVQIYADFSGYSDIARGSARLLGFDLVRNFNHPYLSRSPQEFWKRWHISLSFWLRDYLYIPLGGSRCSRGRHMLNLFVTWFICGLWHGASWNFIIWGLYNGFLVSLSGFWKRKEESHKPFPMIRAAAALIITYCIMNIGWVFFRVQNIPELLSYFSIQSIVRSNADLIVAFLICVTILFYSLPLLLADVKLLMMGLSPFARVFGRDRYQRYIHLLPYYRGICYSMSFIVIVIFGATNTNEFIYFQF